MQIESTHFIPQCPGIPVHKMSDGTLRLPYSKSRRFLFFFKLPEQIFWLSEKELLNGVSDQNHIAMVHHKYTVAMKEIEKAEVKKSKLITMP